MRIADSESVRVLRLRSTPRRHWRHG
jgi:hypothetical protein